jgi:hypothetical protein
MNKTNELKQNKLVNKIHEWNKEVHLHEQDKWTKASRSPTYFALIHFFCSCKWPFLLHLLSCSRSRNYFAFIHFSCSCKWTSLFHSCVLFTFTNLFCFNSFFLFTQANETRQFTYMDKKNELKQNNFVNVNKTWMKQGSSLTWTRKMN